MQSGKQPEDVAGSIAFHEEKWVDYTLDREVK
jgi:hypothetical protein